MRRPLFTVCLCLVAAAALWLSLYELPKRAERQALSELSADGEVITVTGRVYQKNSNEFRIQSVKQSKISSAAASRQTIPINDNLICETKTLTNIPLGSMVQVQGDFEPFSKATNPGEFDAAEYYGTQGICGKLTDITVLSVSSDYSLINEALYQIRCYFKERLYRVFPEKEASILTAMLLGDKEELDTEIKDLYMENGIVHILSISGLHITMIGMGIYKLLRRMGVPVWIAACLGGVVLVLYGVMTGMSVSACRAIGMYLIRMLAVTVGRTYDMLTALGVMAVYLVGQNPANLTNAGFLLSFGSIMGIGLLYPSMQGNEERTVPKPIQSILVSGSITLFTLPIQLWFYYEVPTYSVLVNLLILPFMSAVMVTGLIAMLLPGAGLVGTVTCLILQGYEWLCGIFSQLPYHTWNPGKPEVWQVVVYYLILSVVICLGCKRTAVTRKNNWKYACKAFLLTAAVITLAVPLSAGNTVTFLDVGQGDGVLVETASGKVYLFDCGSSSRKRIGEYVLIPFLKYRGIQHIDAVFVSHADSDHCSGIEELFALGEEKGISVGQLVLPAIAEEEREEEFGELIQAAKGMSQETPISISYMEAGDSFVADEAAFLCLHPPSGYEAEDSNAYSQCFYVELRGTKKSKISLLLTGDVQEEGESVLLQELKHRNIENVTVLKVAHHGSRNSTSEDFLAEVSPRVAIISCGEENSYGHPHAETLERLEDVGSAILATPECGAIRIEIGRKVTVRSWLQPD